MCGRYNIIDDPLTQGLLQMLDIDIHLPIRYNIAPTEQVPVIYRSDDTFRMKEMRWWLVPSWSDGPSTKYAMFNARAESVTKSKAFRGPFKHHRAIIPASSFIEWQKQDGQKIPYDIRPADCAIAFAGLWDFWSEGDNEVYSCTVITTDAVPQFKHVHSRMPVMLDHSSINLWLDPDQNSSDLMRLLAPSLPGDILVTLINKGVNNSRNKEPISQEGESELIKTTGFEPATP